VLTISKALSAGQAKRYHEQEFSNASENYYTVDDTIRGQWHGTLAREWGLSGEVQAERFQRLADGEHPLTCDRLVRHRTVCTYINGDGKTVTTMAHRAGWDATFSAPKSVSLTALVGGDDRVREAHQASVSAALAELEPYVQARRGDQPAQTTGQMIAARFEHDNARPVDGYAAPQLHAHVVIFNVTRTEEGDVRPVEPRELYRTQQYATSVYRSELAVRLRRLGYQVERGASDQPEIRGYTSDYLEASSPRRQQIEAHLREHHQRGAGAAQIAAHHTREAKLEESHESMQARHRAMVESFGEQPDRVVREAHERAVRREEQAPRITAGESVTFAIERNFEREAVVGARALRNRISSSRDSGSARVRLPCWAMNAKSLTVPSKLRFLVRRNAISDIRKCSSAMSDAEIPTEASTSHTASGNTAARRFASRIGMTTGSRDLSLMKSRC
jgi:conjugative relaxase-like TrwC/TraI family protein